MRFPALAVIRVCAVLLGAYIAVLAVVATTTAVQGPGVVPTVAWVITGALALWLTGMIVTRPYMNHSMAALTALLLFGTIAHHNIAIEVDVWQWNHAGLGAPLLAVADAWPRAEPALKFALARLDDELGLLAPFALLYFTVVFPRVLGPADVPSSGRLRRLLLRRGVLPAFGVVLYAILSTAVASTMWVVIPIVIGLSFLFIRTSYVAGDTSERRRLAWVFSGLAISALSFAVALVAGFNPFLDGAVADSVARAATQASLYTPPIAFSLIAVAALYRGAIDPTLVVRKTTMYAVLGGALALTFAVLESYVTGWIAARAGLSPSTGIIAALIVTAVMAEPLRRRISRLVDVALAQDAKPSLAHGVTIIVRPAEGERSPYALRVVQSSMRRAVQAAGGELRDLPGGAIGTVPTDAVDSVIEAVRRNVADYEEVLEEPAPILQIAIAPADCDAASLRELSLAGEPGTIVRHPSLVVEPAPEPGSGHVPRPAARYALAAAVVILVLAGGVARVRDGAGTQKSAGGPIGQPLTRASAIQLRRTRDDLAVHLELVRYFTERRESAFDPWRADWHALRAVQLGAPDSALPAIVRARMPSQR